MTQLLARVTFAKAYDIRQVGRLTESGWGIVYAYARTRVWRSVDLPALELPLGGARVPQIMNSLGDLSSVSIKAYEPFTELDIDYKVSLLRQVHGTCAYARSNVFQPSGMGLEG